MAIIILALVFALGEARTRYSIEADNRNVEILMDFSDLQEQIERQSLGNFNVYDYLEAMGKSGAGGVLIKEQSLEDLLLQGELQVVPGVQLLAASRNGELSGFLAGFADLAPYNPRHLYLEIFDPLLWERVAFQLEQKVPGTVILRPPGVLPENPGTIFLQPPDALPDSDLYDQLLSQEQEQEQEQEQDQSQEQIQDQDQDQHQDQQILLSGILSLPLIMDELADTGIGFSGAELERVSALGMNIYLRMYGWSGDEERIAAVTASLAHLPKIDGILFQSAQFPGYPAYTKLFAAELERLSIPIVTIDLFELQRRPLLSLVRSSTQKEVIRLHAIPLEERALLSRERALDRYLLAASERNNRLLLVRSSGRSLLGDPWLQENADFIADLGERLTSAGLTLGSAKPYSSADFPPFSRVKIIIVCAGILAGLALLFKKMGLPLPGYLIAAAGLLLVLLLLVSNRSILGFSSFDLVRKSMILISGVTFPLLGLLLFRRAFGNRSISKSITAFLGITTFSLVGAFLAAGLVTELTYLVKLDQIQGIRLALLLPLPLAWLLLFLSEEGTLRENCRKLLKLFDRPLVVGSGILTIFLLVAAYVVLSRSGNESALISDFELQFRSLLGDLLSVRPRTKELLIGHPLLLLAMYFGFRNRLGLLTAILGMIGQVSLVNTFFHLHTPLIISLQRTAIGLALGIILGLFLVQGVKMLEKPLGNFIRETDP